MRNFCFVLRNPAFRIARICALLSRPRYIILHISAREHAKLRIGRAEIMRFVLRSQFRILELRVSVSGIMQFVFRIAFRNFVFLYEITRVRASARA